MPHSARKLPADLQAAMLKPDKPGPSIGKRRTKKAPKIPAWCPLPVTAWWDGRDSAAYQDALDHYCMLVPQRLSQVSSWRDNVE